MWPLASRWPRKRSPAASDPTAGSTAFFHFSGNFYHIRYLRSELDDDRNRDGVGDGADNLGGKLDVLAYLHALFVFQFHGRWRRATEVKLDHFQADVLHAPALLHPGGYFRAHGAADEDGPMGLRDFVAFFEHWQPVVE